MKEFEQKYKEFNFFEIESNDPRIGNVAKTYAKVFAGWPWYEVSKGTVCEKFYGTNYLPGSECPCGCGKLTEAYPFKDTIVYITEELQKSSAIGLIVAREEDSDDIVGFSWAFKTTGREFAETKYRTDEAKRLIKSVINPNDTYFYFSEAGVLPEFQAKGIGTQMYQLRIRRAQELGMPILLRTNEESPVVKIASRFGMTPIIGPGTSLLDPENPKRIIFTLPWKQ